MRKIDFSKTKLVLAISYIYLISAQVSLAQPGNRIVNPINIGSIDELLERILEFIVLLGTPIITLAIIYSGFKFVKARGNPEEIKDARRTLMYVLIGAAIILGAQVLKTVITGTVDDIQADIN